MRLPALEADAPAPRGLRPDESEPDARDDGFSERNAARHRWGHCAWFTDGGVCLWGGRPGMDNRNVLMYGRGGTLVRVRFHLTRRRRAFPHPPRIPEPNARPPRVFARERSRRASLTPSPLASPPSPSIAGTQQRERILTRGECPAWRESHTCVPVKRGAAVAHVIFGGHGAPTRPDDDEGPPLDDAHLIDATLNWRALRPSGKRPSARGGHCAVAVAPDRVLVFGGKGRDGALHGDVAILELRSRSAMAAGWGGKHLECAWEFPAPTGASRPTPREGACAVFIPPRPHPDGRARDGDVWVFGGFGAPSPDARGLASASASASASDATCLNDVWRYSVADNEWLPAVRRGAQLGPGSETWPAPRCGHSAVVLPANAIGEACCRWAGGRPDAPVVLFHGGVGADGVALGDVWLFAPDVQDFQLVSPKTIVGFVPKPKAMHACVDVGSKVFFIGGAGADTHGKQSAMHLDDSYAIRLCNRKGGLVEGGPFSGSVHTTDRR